MEREWHRSETLALAQQSCTFCFGVGMRPGRAGVSDPCNCVYRAIFRACYDKFNSCIAKEKSLSRVSLEANAGLTRRSVWGLQDEEYAADFCLVARRTLSLREHQLFRYHYLLHGDWQLCCRALRIGRNEFFYEIYRIEQKLGRTFRDLKPHALFPVAEYFDSSERYKRPAPQPALVIDVEDRSVFAPIRTGRAKAFPLAPPRS